MSELTCGPAAAVSLHGATIDLFRHADTPVRVTGIVTDAVPYVAIELHNGRVIRVGVRHNTFLYQTDQVPSRVTWVGPRGTESDSFRALWHWRRRGYVRVTH